MEILGEIKEKMIEEMAEEKTREAMHHKHLIKLIKTGQKKHIHDETPPITVTDRELLIKKESIMAERKKMIARSLSKFDASFISKLEFLSDEEDEEEEEDEEIEKKRKTLHKRSKT
jgi:hypothetical protein